MRVQCQEWRDIHVGTGRAGTESLENTIAKAVLFIIIIMNKLCTHV